MYRKFGLSRFLGCVFLFSIFSLVSLSAEESVRTSSRVLVKPFANIGYSGFSNGTGKIDIVGSSAVTIENFKYDSLKLGLGLATAKADSEKISIGVFAELRLLLGLGQPGQYKYSDRDGPNFIADDIGFGLAVGPSFYFPPKGNKSLSWALAPYVALGYIPTEGSSIISAIFSVVGGLKLDLFIHQAFGLNAGLELGYVNVSSGGYTNSGKNKFSGSASSLQIGFYAGVSAQF